MNRASIIKIIRRRMPKRVAKRCLSKNDKMALKKNSYIKWAYDRCIDIVKTTPGFMPEFVILDELDKFAGLLDQYSSESNCEQFSVAYDAVTDIIGAICAEEINELFTIKGGNDDNKRLPE